MDKIYAFLSRIGLEDIEIKKDLDFLGRVQYSCVLTIPYENLDILAGIPVSLDKDDIYDKIVTRHRGGYCFELNALLHHMLCDIGFRVKSRFARFLRGESTVPFRRHRIVIVNFDGKDYLMDIGVGQTAPRLPLEICEGLVQVQGSETYRFEKDETLGWVLCDLYKGEWRRYICFNDDPAFEVDFVPASFWCEKHPESPFNKAPMLAIKTEKGRKTVDGSTFKMFEGDELVFISENLPENELKQIYRIHFGLNMQ